MQQMQQQEQLKDLEDGDDSSSNSDDGIKTGKIPVLSRLRAINWKKIAIIAGIIILYMILYEFKNIISLLQTITTKSGINSQFLSLLLKITGIALLTEFAISICKDAGESAIASKIEIGSKVVVISMSIPLISVLLEVILKLL